MEINRADTNEMNNMRVIFDNTPYALGVITDGVFVEANEPAFKMFHAKNRTDIIGKPPGVLSPQYQPDGCSSDEKSLDIIKRALAGSHEVFEWQHQTLDGQTFSAKVNVKAFEYMGKLSLMVAYEDITQQKIREEELQIARQNMQTIFDTNPFSMLIITDGVFVEANEAAISLYGASSKKDLIGKSPIFFSPPFQANGRRSDEMANEVIQRTMSEETVSFDWEYFKLNKNLKLDEIPIDCHVNLSKIIYNGKLSLMTVIQDLTEQRKQQKRIQYLKEKADMIIEKNPALIFIIEKNERILQTNQAWVDISGYSKEQFLSMKLSDFKVTERSGGAIKDVIESGESTSGNLRFESPKGTLYLRFFYVPMFDEKGKIESILGVYFDETDIKKLRIQLDNSISEVGRVLSQLAKKDLTVVASIEINDPLKTVKEDLNATINDLRKILSDILTAFQSLANSIRDITRSTADLAQASNEVANTSQNVADEITRQRDELEVIGKDVSDLSASIEEIAASAVDVRDITTKVTESGAKAQKRGIEATNQMKVVEEISSTSVEQIRSLNNQMQEIGKIVRLISDIASQTNLLALNAAIEAARAGDAGRGFAVVAGEVKSLAGESRQATQNIEEVISKLMDGSNKTAESIDKSYNTIVEGIKTVNVTIQGLNQIVSDIDVASVNISEISRATDSQAMATNRVNQSIDVVSQMIVANQEKMDSLSANAEESSAATEEIASASSMILDMVKKLQSKIEEFSV